MLFILDKKLEVIDTLSNKGETSSITPYFEDEYKQYLSTGAETYSFQTLANTREAQHLTVGNYIAFMFEKQFKLFHITQIDEEHTEYFVKTVYCEMAGIELINDVVRPVKIMSASVSRFLDTILAETEWKIGTVDLAISGIHDFEIKEYTNAYSALQEYVCGVYGGEISLTVDIKGGRVVGKYINVYAKRGRSLGFRFAYSSNISSITRTVDSSNLATALIGVGKDGLTFKSVETPDKPLNQDFIADEESYKIWNNNGSHIIAVEKFDTDSPHELLRLTREKLAERKNPNIKYELKTELLEQSEVQIGDTVTVVDHEFNPPIYLEARVNELTTSFTNPNKNECVLANFVELNSNISKEMKQLANQLEGYVDAQFPISGDKIQEGAVGQQQISKTYTTQVVADAVYASLLETEELVAGKANISDLTAVNAKIENLTVENARIENLVAENADITNAKIEALRAEKANISDLNATNATIGTLQANKADITELNAVKGNITILQSEVAEIGQIKSDVAEIEHILAGNITADNIASGTITSDKIQTGAITAGSGIIAEGSIGNAQISSLDAGKVTAGTVDTSKVTIQGANGHLRIKGNRLQVFNGTGSNATERVSVGDVNGDGTIYGLRVRGADGKTVLLDENGVTREGITDGSITNDKISDNAEIDGAKLNINSVVSKLNEDGTEVIKGTKIEVDGTSLTTKLSTITNKQTEQGEKITQNSASIQANENAIKLKVDNQTYQTDKTDMTSKLNKNTSEISTMKGEIALKVEQTDIDTAISNIKIGSANLLRDSEKERTTTRFLEIPVHGVLSEYINREIYVSFDCKINDNGTERQIRVYPYQDNGISIANRYLFTPTKDYQRYGFKTTVKDFGIVNPTYTKGSIGFYDDRGNNSYSIRKIQIELGNVPTEWHPHSEDIEGVVDTKINTAKAEIKVTTDAITQSVSNLSNTVSTKADGTTVSALSNKVGTLETSVNGIKGSVSSLQTTTTTLGTQVDTAQDTADSAITKANSAQTTANTANSTANSNKTNITNLQGEVKTVKSDLASLEVTTSGISQKVSNVESTTATLTTKVNTAQSTANTANTLAGTKAKVFTSTPTVPYQVGDLWVQGTGGDVMRCKTARSSGSYTASDWEKASKYTDDTKANAVDSKVTTLTATVNTTNSKVAELTTNLDSITQRVSSTESTLTTTTNKLNDLQVGGRNLFIGGKFATHSQYNTITSHSGSESITLEWTASYTGNIFTLSNNGFVPKGIYTLSGYIKVNNEIPSSKYFTGLASTYGNGLVENYYDATTGYFRITQNYVGNASWIVHALTTRSSGSSDTVILSKLKFEKGNKATDWTPAPEDVQSQIDSHTSQISTTNNKVSEIETNLSGITSRVSSVETKTNTIDGKVTAQESRLATAEQKITPSAITSTVRNSTEYQNDLGGKASTSAMTTLTQTVNDFTFKVNHSGGANLLQNGRFISGRDYFWEHEWDFNGTNKYRGTLDSSYQWCLDGRNVLQLRATNSTKGQYGVAQTLTLKKNCTYTVSGYGASHRCNFYVYVQRNGDDWWVPAGYWNAAYGGKNETDWDFWSYTFTTDEGKNEYNFHFSLRDAGNDAYAWFTDLCVTEGSIKQKWSPHTSEIYEGIVRIDNRGVTVSHSDTNTATNLNSEGLSILDKSSNKELAYFGKNNSAYISELKASSVVADNVMPLIRDKGNVNIYVRVGGTGTGTGVDSNNRASSITNALEQLAIRWGLESNQFTKGIMLKNTTVIVNCDGSTSYSENVLICNIRGGSINLNFDKVCQITGTVTFKGCDNPYVIGNKSDINTNDGARFYRSGSGNALSFIGCKVIQCRSFRMYNSVYDGRGIDCYWGGALCLNSVDIYGFYVGIGMADGGVVNICNVRGHGMTYGLYLNYGTVLHAVYSVPNSAISYNNGSIFIPDANGFGSYNQNSIQVAPPAPTYTSQTNSFSGHTYRSDRPTYSSNGVFNQSHYNSQYGAWEGVVHFTDVNVWLSNSTGQPTAKVYLQRKNSAHGYSSGARPNLVGYGYLVGDSTGTNGLNQGQGDWFTVPANIVNELKAGTRNWLSFKDTSAYHYILFETNAILKVTANKPN